MRVLPAILAIVFLYGNGSGAVARGKDQMTPQVEKVIAQIDEGFRGHRWPAKFAVIGAYDEELIDRDFALLPSLPDPSELVRQHRNALHALTDEGFAGALPFYLRTGLTSPKSEVMDHVVYFVNTASKSNTLRSKLARLDNTQLASLRAALTVFRDEYCSNDQFLSKEINRALETIRRTSN